MTTLRDKASIVGLNIKGIGDTYNYWVAYIHAICLNIDLNKKRIEVIVLILMNDILYSDY